MSEGFDTAALARMVRTMPPQELAQGLRLNRDAILGEVFRRFPDQLTQEGRSERAVIKWRLTGGEGEGGYDRWYVVLADGRCDVGPDLDLKPRVTFTVDALDFLRLATGNANPTRLWLTRRLRIQGDVLWAARMPRFFRVPG